MVRKGEFVAFAAGMKSTGDFTKNEPSPSTELSIIIELSKKVLELEARIIELEKRR